jgi:hypothetical protein
MNRLFLIPAGQRSDRNRPAIGRFLLDAARSLRSRPSSMATH